MKTITIEQALKMGWCYDEKKLRDIAGEKQEWSALDILNLPDVPEKDKLFAVLNVELIDEPIMHEFACRCAERALSKIAKPNPRSVAVIAAKRAWLKGEITDDELRAAQDAAWDAALVAAGEAAGEAAWYATWYTVEGAAWEAADEAADEAARGAAWGAERGAALGAAWGAERGAALVAAGGAARDAERRWQVEELKRMLEAE